MIDVLCYWVGCFLVYKRKLLIKVILLVCFLGILVLALLNMGYWIAGLRTQFDLVQMIVICTGLAVITVQGVHKIRQDRDFMDSTPMFMSIFAIWKFVRVFLVVIYNSI